MVFVAPTNLTSTSCGGLFPCFADYANTITGGYFWAMALFGFMVVMFLAMSGVGNKRAYGGASFFGGFLAIFMALGGFIGWGLASLFLVNMVLGIVVMIKGGDLTV